MNARATSSALALYRAPKASRAWFAWQAAARGPAPIVTYDEPPIESRDRPRILAKHELSGHLLTLVLDGSMPWGALARAYPAPKVSA